MNTTSLVLAGGSLAWFLASPRAGESLWQASSGQHPHEIWPAWERAAGGTPPTATLSDGVLQIDGPPGTAALYYQQKFGTLAFPSQLVMEIRLQYVSGYTTGIYTHAAICWTSGNSVGNSLGFRADQIFLMTTGDVVGPTASIDTAGAAHTYRIEVDGVTAGSAIRVYQDGSLVLNGNNYSSSNWFGTEPRIYWGDGTSASYGVCRWHSVRHNALASLPVRQGHMLLGYVGRNRAAIDSTIPKASSLGPDPTVPSPPYEYVLQMTPHPENGYLYGLISPESTPRLIRIDPYSPKSTVIGPIQTDPATIAGVEGLACNPVTGQLFASGRTSTSGTSSSLIFTVDAETGRATWVGTVSGTIQNDADHLGFIGDTLYVMDARDISANPGCYLYRVTRTPGQWSYSLIGAPDGNGHVSACLAYCPDDGQFYSWENYTRKLIRIDPASGGVTEVGVTHTTTELPGQHYGLAFFKPRAPSYLRILPQAVGHVLEWPSHSGFRYQILSCTDLSSWTASGSAFDGNGDTLSVDIPTTGDARRFFRVELLNAP